MEEDQFLEAKWFLSDAVSVLDLFWLGF